MLELRPTEDIDEKYILELHEHRCEIVKVMNALISDSLTEEEVVNVTLLIHFYCSTIPPLQQFKDSNLGDSITEFLSFLTNLIDYAESAYGILSDEANEKIEEYDAIIRYIDNRLSSIEYLEGIFTQS